MAARGTLGFVTSRAGTRRSAVVALLVSVLVICTLVTGLITSMGPLTQSALDSSIGALPSEDTVVEVSTAYDDEEPQQQEAAVREALTTVTGPLGGPIVSSAEGVAFDLLGNATATPGADFFRFSTLQGAEGRLELAEGRRARPGTFETVVPRQVAEEFGLAVGDRLRMRNRYDDSIVRPTVVGIWLRPDPEQARWVGGLLGTPTGSGTGVEADADTGADPGVDPGDRLPPLLTSAESFRTVAGPVPSVEWRAAPALDAATTDDLPALADAAARLEVELEAVEAETGSSLQVTNPLPAVIEGQQRAVAVFRSLLLVPAVLLLILGLVGLTMVAGLLAGSRESEETLLRSRGATPWQLVRPTLTEAAACGALGAVAGPLAAAWLGPIDGVGNLGLAGWSTGVAAGAACTTALALPSVVRALSQRGERSDPSPKERRRRITGLAFGLILLVALGLASVAQLLRYETIGSAGGTASVDPLLVAAPGLVLVTGCVLLSLAAIPLAHGLTAMTGGLRGLAGALSTRSVARAAGSAIPLMLVVASGTGIVWFAALQQTSQSDARATRATYAVGADVRVQQPPTDDASMQTQQALRSLDGVSGVMPVRTETLTVDREQVDLVMADLTSATGTALDPDRFALAPTGAATNELVDRTWATSGAGVSLPSGTETLAVGFDGADARVGVVAVLADRRGTLTSTALDDGDGPRAQRRWAGGLQQDHRLVGLQVTAEFPGCRAANPAAQRLAVDDIRVDGQPATADVTWSAGPGGTGPEIVHDCSVGRVTERIALLGGPTDQAAPPAALTRGLADRIDVGVGDEVRFSLDDTTLDLTVAAVLPVLPGVEDGREGVLLDRSTVAPTLLAAGQSVRPSSWWLVVDEGAEVAPAAVRARVGEAAVVTTRQQVLGELADDPGTGGAGLATSLRWTAAGGGVVCLLLLSAAALLRRGERARQAGVLRALGAGQRSVVGVIGGEYALTAGLGAAVGAVVGTGVAALVLPVVTLGPGGVALTPPPVLTAPWSVVLLGTAVLLLVPLSLVLTLARSDARGAMVTDMRTLEHG